MKGTLAKLVAENGLAAVLATLSQLVAENVSELEEFGDSADVELVGSLESVAGKILAVAVECDRT